MFRELRRQKQHLSEAETIEILQSCSWGVLAEIGDNDYPYAIPLSYAYKDGRLYFHFAPEGHKFDSLEKNDKVSFCVVETANVIPESFTTHYRSAIVFGKLKLLTEDHEKKYAMECIVEKYSPDYIKEGQLQIERDWNRFSAAELTIEHMTGKASTALLKAQT